ncbi:4Fe-4S binding domain protein, partial [Vibrio parahaemolyticus V-223/04]
VYKPALMMHVLSMKTHSPLTNAPSVHTA